MNMPTKSTLGYTILDGIIKNTNNEKKEIPLNTNNDYTISLWLFITGTRNNITQIFQFGDNIRSPALYILKNSYKLLVRQSTTNRDYNLDPIGGITDSKWGFITITYNKEKNNMSVYIDGELKSTLDFPASCENDNQTSIYIPKPVLPQDNRIKIGYLTYYDSCLMESKIKNMLNSIQTMKISSLENDVGYIRNGGNVTLTEIVLPNTTSFTGNLSELNGKISTNKIENMAQVAISNKYIDLDDKPEFTTKMSDWMSSESPQMILNKPTKLSQFDNDIGYIRKESNVTLTEIVLPNTSSFTGKLDELNGKISTDKIENIARVAISNKYTDLDDKPEISRINSDWLSSESSQMILNKPTKLSQFDNDVGYLINGEKAVFSEITTTNIKLSNINKFTGNITELNGKLSINQLSNVSRVAISNKYTDLDDKPELSRINSDWLSKETPQIILNKPTKLSQFDNDVGYLINGGDIVAKSLKGTPEIPLNLEYVKFNVDTWHHVVFENSWINYGNSLQFDKVQYTKDFMGFVHLIGVTSALTKNGNFANIFTLPQGYRPEGSPYCTAYNINTNNTVAIRISSNGQVQYMATAMNQAISLHETSFMAFK
jgi:hypothetical protein